MEQRMRRIEKAIVQPEQIEDVMRRAEVCRLEMVDADGSPYIVPMNFGYETGVLYLHCAREGRKLDILRHNNRVCFEMDLDHEWMREGEPCQWGMRYRSVIGAGRATLIDDSNAVRHALDAIMSHYGAGAPFVYSEAVLKRTMAIRIDIESISGKQAGYES